MKITQLLIDNSNVAAEGGATFDRIGPLSDTPDTLPVHYPI